MHVSVHIRTAFITILAAAALVPTAAARPDAVTLSPSERALLAAVNDVRSDNGLRPLRVDGPLMRAARSYSATMIRRDVFTHGAFGARLAAYGARGPVFGENLAWGVGARAAARSVVGSWMASPGHRTNLLRPGWTRIGIGAVRGNFQGYDDATVVTADFAGN